MKQSAARKPGRAQRILIVDDQPLVCLGLAQLLSTTSDLEAGLEADAATTALALLDRRPAALVLTEIDLPGRSGFDLAKELQVRHPKLPVLIHTSRDESIYARRAIDAGARGFISKTQPPKVLLQAIRSVLGGNLWYRGTAAPLQTDAADLVDVGSLTSREFEVFRLVGKGCNTAEIASQLHISIKTVDAHREHVKRKLNLSSGTALNLLAIRWVTAH